MIKYRPHKGSLEESMKEYKEFDGVVDMLKYIADEWHGFIDIKDIVITNSDGLDDRIGWKSSRYVCIARILLVFEYEGAIHKQYKHYDKPQCIGMCDLGELG